MTTIFKKVALASVLALSFAGAAQATVYNIPTVTESYGTTIVPGAVGSFSDQFNFTVAPNLDANISALSYKVISNGITLQSFALYSYALGTTFSQASATLLDKITYTKTAGEFSPSLYYTNLNSKLNYAVLIDGKAFSKAASYSTNINISPVPEPETYAMLLAGLGVMGFVARRRQKSNKA